MHESRSMCRNIPGTKSTGLNSFVWDHLACSQRFLLWQTYICGIYIRKHSRCPTTPFSPRVCWGQTLVHGHTTTEQLEIHTDAGKQCQKHCSGIEQVKTEFSCTPQLCQPMVNSDGWARTRQIHLKGHCVQLHTGLQLTWVYLLK